MRLIRLPLRNLRQRPLAASLTGISVLLGTALVAFIWIARAEAEEKYNASARGYRAIVGPPGTSALDLVLNTVFNLGVSQGVVPLSVYKDLYEDRIVPGRKLGMRYAIPTAVGDNYKNYRIVATTEDWFTKFQRGDDGPLQFAQGRGFQFTHEEMLELAEHIAEHHVHDGGEHHHHEVPEKWKQIVLGSEVAKQLGMTLDDVVIPAHGIGADLEEHPEAACKVVGILARTGTPIDRALYMPLGAFWLLQGHDAISPTAEDQSADNARISAVIVDARDRLTDLRLRAAFRDRPVAQAAATTLEIQKLFAIVGDLASALRWLGVLVMFVAGLGVLVALYNTMNERRREIAIMRALGARRYQILVTVLTEAILICMAGGALGVAAAHAGAALFTGPIERLSGVSLAGAKFTVDEIWLILGAVLLGAAAGVLPAFKASATPVAENLSPTS